MPAVPGPTPTPVDAAHRELLAELEALAGHGPVVPDGVDAASSYSAGGHPYYGVPVPERRRLVRRWLAGRRSSGPEQILATADSLLRGVSFEERTLGCLVLEGHPGARAEMAPAAVDEWLEGLVGWAEVDSLCQSVFRGTELLGRWPAWRDLIVGLGRSPDPARRRASLVLLTAPVKQSADERLSGLAVRMIDAARAERDPLITKAVSWLLRCLTTNHPGLVARYLDENADSLAPIAVRETRTKLRTGTKRGG